MLDLQAMQPYHQLYVFQHCDKSCSLRGRHTHKKAWEGWAQNDGSEETERGSNLAETRHRTQFQPLLQLLIRYCSMRPGCEPNHLLRNAPSTNRNGVRRRRALLAYGVCKKGWDCIAQKNPKPASPSTPHMCDFLPNLHTSSVNLLFSSCVVMKLVIHHVYFENYSLREVLTACSDLYADLVGNHTM